ncbi:3-hydroxyacyl-CoA dehydrogenase NAD-binding domain-containing protein [Marinicella sp. S1101]|uniref:3-hydroxyacyl-CoA dehydrogenase NAD-binding domain-containing protein n=1 Tax=Marinicella marina TaxID=2996016 RepID=UPI002260A160|nr:3-hydroxyacyl-CoA dehydrogenase NAD-binding domain-containing protein [Marinicella marina]MCX7553973.1 3-hydroxyacyl-CoA dehydrogenase NAD-binding domain-containing protein [Marinicella marina]MDJ1140465.1 3-hydroxyacyl-CoA dehydrogenase NAD-binding domain-containing protein [Marinicella marina]
MANFKLTKDNEIATIWMDQAGAEVNTLSVKMLDDFSGLLDKIENDSDIKAAVLISKKDNCFIAGADIKDLMAIEDSKEVENLSREGNKILTRLSKLKKPVIAAINGACLGGGLEVAMACHYRVATTDKKTVFGLPEMKLGLLPGGGGTQRLIRLTNLRYGLDALLTGKNIYPHSAKKSGLVDSLVHKEGLYQAALKVAANPIKRKAKKVGLVDKALKTSAGRNFVLKKARETVMRKTRGNYPAPLKILDCVETGLEHGMAAGLEAEAIGFGELHATQASKSLIGLFLAMQENKKLKNNNKTENVDTLSMIGAGFMGAGITEVSIKNGYDVILKDISEEGLASALKTIWSDFSQMVKKKAMGRVERDRLMSKIKTTTDDNDLNHSDLIIEAVFEDIGLKQKILADVEARCKKSTVFATNTSSLPLANIAEKAANPQNVVGMHYFSPVPKMPLLELIVTDKTSKRARQMATNVGIKQGKTVVAVKDGPGFYTTRVLSALTHEAIKVLHDGAKIEDVDAAMKDWGFPVGPLALMDEVGIDVGAHIARGALGDMFVARGVEQDDTVQKLADAKLFGRKVGKGFYSYPKKGRKTVNTNIYQFFGGEERKEMDKTEIQNRIGLVFVNECVLCLQEGILFHAKDGDLAAILGLGFPPFTGGPFSYIDATGAADILATLQALEAKHGNRFTPADLLVEHAKDNKPFV